MTDLPPAPPEGKKTRENDPAKFAEFTTRYQAELAQAERSEALTHLRELARTSTMLTLLTATKDFRISEAAVLAEEIERMG